MLTKLVVEQFITPKKANEEEKNKSIPKKSHLQFIADIARRFCALSPKFVHPEAPQTDVLEISNEKELLDAISSMLAENKALRVTLDAQTDRIAYLEALSTSDELTGVLNRRGFEAAFRSILARAQRDAKHGILIYLDLDDFKQINDTYGHAAGDEVLRAAANILTQQTREMDVIGRLGGDEFAIILVDTSRENGLERAETLNQILNTTLVAWKNTKLPIRASFGMQSYQSGDHAETLLTSADQAMYKIKQIKEDENRLANEKISRENRDLGVVQMVTNARAS